MSKTQSVKIKDPKGKEIWAPCGHCGKQTAHLALTEVDLEDSTTDEDIKWWSQNYIIQCRGCKTVSFCEESQCTEDLLFNKDGNAELEVQQKVYPGRVAGRPLLEEFIRLPYGIAMIYKQTHEATCSKLSILAGIGLRAIVEAICKENHCRGKSLLLKINNLVVQGIITQSDADILQTIRIMGNEAAHEVSANSEEELVTALEVVEHLLRGVYLIRQKAQKLKKLR